MANFPRLILPLSLSYDHRVIDGATAARFTFHLVEVLADMRRLLFRKDLSLRKYEDKNFKEHIFLHSATDFIRS